MSEFDHFDFDGSDLPPLDGEYQPNIAEVLERIKNGTLSEVSVDADGAQMVYLNSRPPAGEGEIWVGPDGIPVSSFMRKFNDNFEGWQPGELVNASFTLTHTRGEHPGLLVSGSYVGDIRHADTFMLPEVSAEDGAVLGSLGMALIDADVQVTGHRRYRCSNMYDYDARIHRINSVQQPWDGETEPQLDERVLIQGEVVDYSPGMPDYKTAVFPAMRIRLANGRVVPIEMTNGQINYEDGSLDLMYPEGLLPGDVVQINSTFGNASKWPGHEDRSPTLHASLARSAYLLQPNAARLATYEAHRADITARLTEMNSLTGQAFRDAYSHLVRTYIEPKGEQQERPRLLLTGQERLALQTLVDRIFPNDAQGRLSTERPLTDFQFIAEMTETGHCYGVDVFGMSRRQFYDFCLDVANGRASADYSLLSGVVYPYWLLSTGSEAFSDQEQFGVFRQAVDHWLPYINGKELIYGDKNLTDPARQVVSGEELLAGQTVVFLAEVAERLPEAREYLYHQAAPTFREAAAREVNSISIAGNRFFFDFCSGLEKVLVTIGAWENNQCVGVRDPAGLSFFVDKLPELGAVASQFEANGKEVMADKVLALMKRIVDLNTLPPYSATE